jgi:carbamate kinase
MRILIALGGNAMTSPEGEAGPDDQIAAVARAAERIADVIGGGAEVLLTHGNGPQVGNLLVKNELAASVVPPVPLDWCGAQTQGTIGFMLMNAIERALAARGLDRRVATTVSRTLVAIDDPGFHEPTKPIGRYLPAAEARVMVEHGQVWEDRGERGWRRVVASPEPLAILDAPAAEALLAAGYVVVAAGGGGIPVVRDPDGTLRGVEAVIDKDLAAALLARTVGARVLVIATDVAAAVAGWGTPQARPLGAVGVADLRRLAADGHFASGSMGPKVEAACRFVESGGERAVITSLDRITDAVAGSAGTIVTLVAPPPVPPADRAGHAGHIVTSER